MRINSVQNCSVTFNALQVQSANYCHFRNCDISHYESKLANTQMFDVVIDSKGLALKDKMTDVLHKIQSFSLYPKENAVAINMIGEGEPAYKLTYATIEKAKTIWGKLSKIAKTKSCLDEYTIITLWLDKCLRK